MRLNTWRVRVGLSVLSAIISDTGEDKKKTFGFVSRQSEKGRDEISFFISLLLFCFFIYSFLFVYLFISFFVYFHFFLF